MGSKSFNDWVMEDLAHAKAQAQEIDDNILLEAKMKKEKEAKGLRRSRRLLQQRREKELQETAEVFLNSINVQVHM